MREEVVVITKAADVEPEAFDSGEARAVKKRILIGKSLQAPNFFMRLFSVEPNGHSPFHRHPWEHEVFVVSGSITVVTENRERVAEEGCSVYVPPGVLHQFKNTSLELVEFICVVPSTGEE